MCLRVSIILFKYSRYMQGHARGNILDEHSSGSAVIEHIDSTSIGGISAGVGVSGASGSRTRRSGLLTVMERPPGKRLVILIYLH